LLKCFNFMIIYLFKEISVKKFNLVNFLILVAWLLFGSMLFSIF
jgi:hypothetical protein